MAQVVTDYTVTEEYESKKAQKQGSLISIGDGTLPETVLEGLKRQVSNLTTKVTELQTELDDIKSQVSSLNDMIKEEEQQTLPRNQQDSISLDELRKQVDQLTAESAEMKTKINDLSEEVHSTKTQSKNEPLSLEQVNAMINEKVETKVNAMKTQIINELLKQLPDTTTTEQQLLNGTPRSESSRRTASPRLEAAPPPSEQQNGNIAKKDKIALELSPVPRKRSFSLPHHSLGRSSSKGSSKKL